jgi:hypothetical protein
MGVGPLQLPLAGMRQMVKDLSLLSQVDTVRLEKLAISLKEAYGFLGSTRLAQLIAEHVVDEAQGAVVFSALRNVGPEGVQAVLKTFEQWREASPQNRASIPDERMDVLRKNLETLIREYPALDRMRKAARLLEIIGNQLTEVTFICDLRPVFNQDRDQVEGLIPLTTLRVDFEDTKRSPSKIEFVLTARQLEELISGAEKAREKLAVLRARAGDWLPGGYVDLDE